MLDLVIGNGAATIGCSAQMVGLLLMDLKIIAGVDLFVGIGTSMLQVPNIIKK